MLWSDNAPRKCRFGLHVQRMHLRCWFIPSDLAAPVCRLMCFSYRYLGDHLSAGSVSCPPRELSSLAPCLHGRLPASSEPAHSRDKRKWKEVWPPPRDPWLECLPKLVAAIWLAGSHQHRYFPWTVNGRLINLKQTINPRLSYSKLTAHHYT